MRQVMLHIIIYIVPDITFCCVSGTVAEDVHTYTMINDAFVIVPQKLA